MNETFSYPENYTLNIDAIPKTLHGNEISQANLERMAAGLQSGLMKDFMIDGRIIDVKLSAYENEVGEVVIDYDERENELNIPNKIFNKSLSDAQKELLINNEILGPIRYKGKDYFVGIDNELNKITVKSSHEMGIASTVAGYQLNGVDKYYLAAGNTTDTRVFKTGKGDYFTAQIRQTSDKKGMEFLNVKFIDHTNAPRLIKELNKDNTITDPKLMLHMVGLKSKGDLSPDRIIDGTYPVLSKTVYDKDEGIDNRSVSKDTPNQGKKNNSRPGLSNKKTIATYEQVTGDGDSFTIKADMVFAPKKFKGVDLNDTQQKDLTKGKRVFLKGVQHNNKSLNGYLKMDKANKTFSFTTAREKSQQVAKQLTKEQDGIERE